MALISMFNRSEESDIILFQNGLLFDSLVDLRDDSEEFDVNETYLTRRSSLLTGNYDQWC